MGKIQDFDPFHVEGMEQKEFKAKQAYVLDKCLCTTCPTYVKGDETTGYCFPLNSSSKVIKWEKECICSKCPIYTETSLTHNHYCTRCSAVCQSYKTELGAGHE